MQSTLSYQIYQYVHKQLLNNRTQEIKFDSLSQGFFRSHKIVLSKFGKRLSAFTLLKKILRGVNDRLRTFSEQIRNFFGADSSGMFEWWTPNTMAELNFKCCASLSLRYLLSVGRNISSKNGFVICFLKETLAFHQWFSIRNLRLKTSRVEEEQLCKIISLFTRQTFSL